MNSRQRNVLIRMLVALGVFVYVGYLGWQQLPRFDFYVVITFFVLYVLWSGVAEAFLYQDPETYVIEDADQRSYLYLQLTFLIALFYSAIDFVDWHYTRLSILEPWVFVLGLLLFLLSCYIRWQAFKSIGKYFNPRVAVYEDHQLITDGAYSKIRHPLYLGTLFSFLSIPIILNSWGGLLIILVTTIPSLVYRIKIEEEFMLKHFNEPYREYMTRTSRLFPGIW